MYACVNDCVRLCVCAFVHQMAEGGEQNNTCKHCQICLNGEAMSSRGPCVSVRAHVCVQWRAEPDRHVAQGNACCM